MEIHKLELQNFKLFRKAEFQFRPLTLLTGANSSGKSTILNAITAVLHCRTPHYFPLEFIPNGPNCSLGGFRDLTTGRSTKSTFSLGLTLQKGKRTARLYARFRYTPSGNRILPDEAEFNDGDSLLSLKWEGQKTGYQLLVDSKNFFSMLADNEFKVLMDAIDAMTKTAVKKGDEIKPDDSPSAFLARQTEVRNKWFTLKERTPTGLTAEIRRQPLGTSVFNEIEKAQQELLQNTAYIGPVRANPSRHYSARGLEGEIDPQGQNAVETLFEWKKHFPQRFKEVIRLASSLQLASSIIPLAPFGDSFKLSVRPYKHKEIVNFADVGFGVSQALPILISDVSLPSNGTMVINQPEVHLHPSSQAALANYFVGRLRNRRYIVETHSEYLITRTRLLVAKGKLAPSQVSIIYLEPSSNKDRQPNIHAIEIDEDGSLKNAPKSFFTTYFQDTFSLATNDDE